MIRLLSPLILEARRGIGMLISRTKRMEDGRCSTVRQSGRAAAVFYCFRLRVFQTLKLWGASNDFDGTFLIFILEFLAFRNSHAIFAIVKCNSDARTLKPEPPKSCSSKPESYPRPKILHSKTHSESIPNPNPKQNPSIQTAQVLNPKLKTQIPKP